MLNRDAAGKGTPQIAEGPSHGGTSHSRSRPEIRLPYLRHLGMD
jgi:hypothetical protein